MPRFCPYGAHIYMFAGVVLKELANEIAPIVTAIFQLSLDTSAVPLDWKKALVTLSFLSFFRYVLTSEEDVRRGSVNECKRGLAENKSGAQLRKRIYRCETRVSITRVSIVKR